MCMTLWLVCWFCHFLKSPFPHPTPTTLSHYVIHHGWVQDFQNGGGGGGGDCKRKVPYRQGPWSAYGPWKLFGFKRCHASWAIFWSILIQNGSKKHSWWYQLIFFWGGGGQCLLCPCLDPPLCTIHVLMWYDLQNLIRSHFICLQMSHFIAALTFPKPHIICFTSSLHYMSDKKKWQDRIYYFSNLWTKIT